MADSEDYIGPYLLERLLGRGTMASVYLARSQGGIDRPVAIKRVHTLAGEEDRERLRREARVMATLDHPNIMRVLDVIPDGDGVALVLPFAPNGSLAQLLTTRGTLSPTDFAAILNPIADALSSAHRHGVVHRDVKPSNILFTSDNMALLADFGVATQSAHTNLTRTDLAIGTAGYLDPEVADGAAPGPQSDIYSLGVVAYEALSGRPPFLGSTPLAVLRASDRGDAAPLLSGNSAIDEVVHRAFNRQSDYRWASATDFAEAFRQAIADPNASFSTDPLYEAPSAAPLFEAPVAEVPLDGTTTFRRRTRTAVLDAAVPVDRKRSRWALPGIIAAVVSIVGGGVAFRSAQDPALKRLPIQALPTCAAETNAQCVTKTARTPVGVTVSFASGTSYEYQIGRSNDALRVANYFCGERATLALYEPSTGKIFYFSNWPDPRSNEPTEALVDETGIRNAQVSIGDRNDDKCADIALDVENKRTWFLPKAQPARLGPVTLNMAFKADPK